MSRLTEYPEPRAIEMTGWSELEPARNDLRAMAEGLRANEDRGRSALRFTRYFDASGAALFEREENEVLARFHAEPPSAVVRMLVDHIEISALARVLTSDLKTGFADADLLEKLAERVERHLAFEEEEVVPLLRVVDLSVRQRLA